MTWRLKLKEDPALNTTAEQVNGATANELCTGMSKISEFTNMWLIEGQCLYVCRAFCCRAESD